MSITTNVKLRVRTTGSEHQGQNSIFDPDQNLGFTCIFSSGMQVTLKSTIGRPDILMLMDGKHGFDWQTRIVTFKA